MDTFTLIVYLSLGSVILFLIYLVLKPAKRPPKKFKPTPILFKPTPSSLRLNNNNNNNKKVKKKKKGAINLTILWGSQTGTAEEFAATLEEEAEGYNFNVENINIEEYEYADVLPTEKMVIFVVATYGEGEPTDNARDFYDWLMEEELEEGLLEGVRFTVFGLGNKTYEHYNQMARDVETRCLALGAKSVYEKGEGDDDCSLAEDFDHWKSRLWKPICEEFNIESEAKSTVSKPNYMLKPHSNDTKLSKAVTWYKGQKIKKGVYDEKNPCECEILVNRELHSEQSDRNCIHMEIKLPSNMKYKPGDHYGIYPENTSELVEAYGKRLDINLDDVVSIHNVDNPNSRPLVGPTTYRRILTSFIDLTTPPSKRLIKVLAENYTEDEEEKERLTLLSSSSDEGWKEYNSTIKNKCKTPLELLLEFPSCKPLFEHFIELMHILHPRMYSISSSYEANPETVHVTAVVVKYQTGTGREHDGICTTWLQPKAIGDTVFGFCRSSKFKLPNDPSVPIIMIGPGTGVAPFRGFLQYRSTLEASDLGPSVLYFGCRARDIDFLYKEELEQYKNDGVLSELYTAFSREQKDKVYVQHLLKENGKETWDLLSAGGYIYVCGDAKYMAKDVHNVLIKIAVEYGGHDEKSALSFYTKLETNNKYQKDVWT
eukprot:TRINITY_DN892_c4_g1_i1.p1 TRINITY_DN892_c4_g1~~TRINITY_DN892_c4_g1_i1.p1  ORF type:complete len:656 (-),score=271.34 TRINITY_DN892_c4_g1_i1:108-2075(-)